MRPGALAYARARAQPGLLLALAGIVLAATFSIVGIDALHRTADRTAQQDALRAGPATSAALQLEVSADRAPALDKLLGSARFAITRSAHTEGFPASHDGAVSTFTARADGGLRDRSVLVDGHWPATAPGPVIHAALQDRAASSLGIRVGDRLGAGTGADRVEIVVDGTWRPKDPDAAAWFGDPASASGRGPDGVGPLVVSRRDLGRLPAPTTAAYVLAPPSSADVSQTRRDLSTLMTAVNDSDVSATVTGGLPQRLADLEATRAAADGLLAVAYALLAVAAIVACRQVVVLLTEARRTESALLRSRGSSTSAMTAAAAAEAAVAAIAGAAIGTAGAVAVFTRLDRAPDTGLAVLAAVACVLVAVVLTAAATASAVRHAASQRTGSRDLPGARRALLILVLGAAALSVGQFTSYGGPLSVGVGGSTQVDPITSLAPAAALAAATLLGMAGVRPVLQRLERHAAGRPGIRPALPARQLARRLSTFGVTIALTSLALGFAIVVATLDGTQTSLDATSASVRTGADVRLDLTVDPAADVGVEAATAPLMRLGDDAAAVVSVPGRVDQDQDEVSFLAAGPTVAGIARGTRVAGDSARMVSALHAGQHGVPISPGTTSVTITVSGAPITGDVNTTAWLVDSAGQIAVRPMGRITGPGPDPVTRAVTVPRNGRDWRLLGVHTDATGVDGDATITVRGLPGADRYDIELINDKSSGSTLVGPRPKRLPVVITSEAAALLQARTGDTFDLLLPDSGFKGVARVVAVVDTLPGVTGARGIAADLPTLVSYALGADAAIPAPDAVWIASAHPDRVIRAATSASVVRTAATTGTPGAGAHVVASALDTWWWAAGSVIVFAALATAAMSTSLGRRRRDELRVLRALGVTPGSQARIRTTELGGAVATGGAVGLMAGAIAVLLTVADLARSATPDRPASVEPELSFAVAGLLALVAALAAAVLAVAIRQARRTRHDAVRTGREGGP
ncbi:FtsX-like permease family protein [Aeromicrobium ginsengisoli]|uniref:FtsX-like permease family protein n=1 Tax=Aeromicrobium ginsengisoli TaxID=363867 RepID=A0A5M4FB04_9ACTN|nr:FtsX-like permease family protein [Aeromicrobium ginsengisoli]KAA1395566.1 FtsX-like permease family protein [Aeromicrobium ginsengisoli]